MPRGYLPLDRLNMTFRDLDESLDYEASRGSYIRQVCECGRLPSKAYRARLARWWAYAPQEKLPAELLDKIRLVAMPWLRAREGHPIQQRFTKRQAEIARKRLGKK